MKKTVTVGMKINKPFVENNSSTFELIFEYTALVKGLNHSINYLTKITLMSLYKQLTILFIGLLLFTTYSSAQTNKGEILGKLMDTSNKEVVYASLALMQNDTLFVNSAVSTVKGDFKFIDIEPGNYTLRVDHIEHETYSSEPFTIAANETKVLPNIVLKLFTNSLDEVIVTRKKRLIEVKADKIIFNVASSPSASGTNGLDLLKKSPGVTLGIDNQIALLGKNNVQIYLNGVPSRLSGDDLTTFLQSLTSDVIDSIEIISNPPAKYDAEGTGGIINIKMKRNIATGFNGSVTSSFTKGVEFKSSNNVSLNLGSGKVNANLDVTQSEDNVLEIFEDQKQQNNALLFLDSEEVRNRKGYNIGFGIDTQLNENHYIGLNARGILNKNDNALNSITDIYQVAPPEFLEILSSKSFLKGNSDNYILNLNHLWNTGGNSNINTNISFGDYDTQRATEQPNIYFAPDGITVLANEDTTFDADTQIKLWSAKMDFEKEWETIAFSTGIKYASIDTQNGFDFFNIVDEESIFDTTKSNDFNYTENVAAFYANINMKFFTSFTLNAGLRIENTDSRGKLISVIDVDNKDVPRNYTDYFPNIGISFDDQKNHSLSLNVGRRITRPNYQDLNPFETPTSQLVIWKGNPFLKPNYIMNYQASYSLKQKLIVTASYSETTDFFAKIVEITGEDQTQIIPRNMERATNYGISASYPITVNKVWDFIIFGNASRQTFEGNLAGTVIDLSNILWDYRIQNNLKIPGGILMDVTFNQQSKWIWRGSVYIKGTEGLSFGIRKELLNKQLQLRITGSDIFRTETEYPYNSNYGGINLVGVYIGDSQRFGLGATFKFGGQQSKSKSKSKSALDEELNRIEN